MNGQNGNNTENQKKNGVLERFSISATRFIGSIPSLVAHTILFTGAFVMTWFGFDLDRVLLVLTTIVSLEAIYLAIFIQMTINRTTAQLEEVEETVEEISEDIEEIQGNVEDIQEDVEEITVLDEEEKMSEDRKIEKIEESLLTIVREIDELKKPKS